jgi:methyl-accepting chemotaxis protein
LLAVGLLAYWQAQTALQQAAYDRLQAVQAIKQKQIEKHLGERESDMTSLTDSVTNAYQNGIYDEIIPTQALRQQIIMNLFQHWQEDMRDISTDPDMVSGVVELSTRYQETGANQIRSRYLGQPTLMAASDATSYTVAHRKMQTFLQGYTQIHHYSDVLLVDLAGNVVYSVQKSPLFATDVTKGELNSLYQQLKSAPIGTIHVADVTSTNSLFMGIPIYREQTQVGILLYELPLMELNTVIETRVGMGQTSETYLVGQVGDQTSYRSDRPRTKEKMGQPTTGAEITAVFKGESGQIQTVNEQENLLRLTVYAPLKLPDIKWAIISSQNVSEIIVPDIEQNEEDYLARYAKTYGYYDLFLIDPSGYVFYTVAHEADYRTNLVNGKYNQTNLGRLVQQVIQTKQFSFIDFEPYAPSNNAPAAFMAMPIMQNNAVQLIVAAQLPLAGLNAIMQERTGMGETGETYLVGPDKRMRSDSFLNPTTHSVDASFAGTVAENGVDTVAVQAALAGQSGAQIITDYRGEQVLSAYAPIMGAGIHWAILAEVDMTEAFAAATALRNLMLIIVGGVMVVVMAVALWIANSLSRPMVQLTEVAQAISQGKLEIKANIASNDEMGILATTFDHMTSNLKTRIETEQQQKAYLEHTVHDYLLFVEGVADGKLNQRLKVTDSKDTLTTLGHHLNMMVERLGEMTTQIRAATSNISSATAEILAAMTQQLAGASEQSAAITQTTSTINEVKTVVEQTYNKAESVSHGSKRTLEISDNGQQAITNTVTGMHQIKDKVAGIAENILALSEQTQQIGEITATVNEIASQSNLLALNASVEAARAGEHGKGFAVVAVEVRNLAEQSKQATAQVKTILSEIQRATNMAVMATEEGTKGVDNGVYLTQQAGETITQLAQSIGDSANAAQLIVASAKQQSAGMEQIALAMQNINQATTQNLASTRQTQQSAQGLAAVARQLESLVAQYELN